MDLKRLSEKYNSDIRGDRSLSNAWGRRFAHRSRQTLKENKHMGPDQRRNDCRCYKPDFRFVVSTIYNNRLGRLEVKTIFVCRKCNQMKIHIREIDPRGMPMVEFTKD